MSNIVNIDDYRPHVKVQLPNGNIDVCPIQMLQDIVHGKLKVTDVDEWEQLVLGIISEHYGLTSRERN